jgi:hypothetical protein
MTGILNMLVGSGGGGAQLFVEDVFSTYLYTGNGSTQTITNGIDLTGKGGLVWTKLRSGSSTYWHSLCDTVRGAGNILSTNETMAQFSQPLNISGFTSTGFTMGSSFSNTSGYTFASWTFREAPNFFDVVTFTPGSTTINHSLGSIPGFIIIKATGVADPWYMVHRGANGFSQLNTADAFSGTGNPGIATSGAWMNCTATTFNVSNFVSEGQSYVAYLYAHDATSDGVIQCGGYTGNGSNTGPIVTLGWEPQWVMIKNTSTNGTDWIMLDNMRGMPVGSVDARLTANTSDAESSGGDFLSPTATGFQLTTTNSAVNANGSTYIYTAIRRGPMKTPTLGTSVFAANISNATGSATSPEFVSNFPVDMYFLGNITNTGGADKWYWMDRLRGNVSSNSTTTAAESAFSVAGFAFNTGVFNTAITSDYYATMFRRAPGFMDVVCYTGINATRTVTHSLGVVPELIIVKNRTTGGTGWPVWTTPFSGTNDSMLLNTTAIPSGSGLFTTTPPTSTVFTVGNDSWINSSGNNYVAYLFASCPGVSKVGTYTGNGSSQTINCAFTTGARFVLIKRTDSTGGWLVWDSARGIVAGNDPYLALNSTAAEVTTDDSVDTDSTGFIVNQVAASNINVNAATYIFLAVA